MSAAPTPAAAGTERVARPIFDLAKPLTRADARGWQRPTCSPGPDGTGMGTLEYERSLILGQIVRDAQDGRTLRAMRDALSGAAALIDNLYLRLALAYSEPSEVERLRADAARLEKERNEAQMQAHANRAMMGGLARIGDSAEDRVRDLEAEVARLRGRPPAPQSVTVHAPSDGTFVLYNPAARAATEAPDAR